MGKNPWMKFYVKDYLTDIDVKALTYEEKGLYTEMLFMMWDNGGVLPGENSKLAKILGFSEKKFEKKYEKISKFFQKVEIDGEVFLTQKRLKKEWEELEEISEKRRRSGEKGNLARWKESVANATDLRAQLQSHCDDFATIDTDTDTESDIDTEKDLKTYSPNGELSTPAGVAPCPHGKITALFSEVLPELPSVAVLPEAWKKNLRTRWREAKERQNLDWWREFFLRIKASDFLMGRVQSHDGRCWQASFDWLIRPSNMAKVLSGKYDNKGRPGAPAPSSGDRPPWGGSPRSIGEHYRKMADDILAEGGTTGAGQGQIIDITDF